MPFDEMPNNGGGGGGRAPNEDDSARIMTVLVGAAQMGMGVNGVFAQEALEIMCECLDIPKEHINDVKRSTELCVQFHLHPVSNVREFDA